MKTYIYRWGNNEVRKRLKGRECVIIATGTMNTVLIQFTDNGELVTTSKRALKISNKKGDFKKWK